MNHASKDVSYQTALNDLHATPLYAYRQGSTDETGGLYAIYVTRGERRGHVLAMAKSAEDAKSIVAALNQIANLAKGGAKP